MLFFKYMFLRTFSLGQELLTNNKMVIYIKTKSYDYEF